MRKTTKSLLAASAAVLTAATAAVVPAQASENTENSGANITQLLGLQEKPFKMPLGPLFSYESFSSDAIDPAVLDALETTDFSSYLLVDAETGEVIQAYDAKQQ